MCAFRLCRYLTPLVQALLVNVINLHPASDSSETHFSSRDSAFVKAITPANRTGCPWSSPDSAIMRRFRGVDRPASACA
jgi:hypothetical protein